MNKKEILLLIDAVDSYDRNLLKGIIKYSRVNTSWLLVRQSPVYRNIKTSETESELFGKNLAGVIVSEYKFSDKLKKLKIPKVIAPYKQVFEGMANILTDNVAIGEMGAKYFMTKGFEHFAFYGYEDSFWSKDRQHAFQRLLDKAGLKCWQKNKKKQSSKESIQKNIENLASWLSNLPKPVAVMICSDDLSFEVMEAARLANSQIPHDIAILGVDNDDLVCELCNPPLSSIEHDSYSVGYNAAKTLDQIIKGEMKVPTNIIGQPHFIVSRQSTDILAVKDTNVSRALTYINEKAPSHNLAVTDVAKITNLSRRQLERKFLNTIFSGIGKEIHRVKVNHIKNLLFSTDLTMQEIALETGFTSFDNFSRYFKQISRMSPREYRKTRIARI